MFPFNLLTQIFVFILVTIHTKILLLARHSRTVNSAVIQARTIRDALHRSPPEKLQASQQDRLARQLKDEFDLRIEQIDNEKKRFEKEYKERLEAVTKSEDAIRLQKDELEKKVLALEKELEERKKSAQEIAVNSQATIQKEKQEQDQKATEKSRQREAELQKLHDEQFRRHLELVATFEKTQEEEKEKLGKERIDLILQQEDLTKQRIQHDKEQSRYQNQVVQLQALRSEVDELKQELQLNQNKLRYLNEEKAAESQTYEQFRQSSQTEHTRIQDLALSRLHVAEKEHKQVLAKITAERDQLKSKCEEDEIALAGKDENLTTLQANFNNLSASFEEKERDLERSRTQTAELSTLVHNLQETNHKDVHNVEHLNKKYEQALSDLSDVSTKHNSLIHNHEDILQKHNALIHSNEKLTKEHNDLISKHEETKRGLQTEQSHHERQYHVLVEKHRALEQEYKSYTSSSGDLDAWQSRLEEQGHTVSQAKKDLETREKDLAKRDELLNRNGEHFADLEERTKKLHQNELELQEKKETFEQSNKQLQSQWDIYHRVQAELQLRKDELDKATASFDTRVNDYQAQVGDKEAHLKERESQLEEKSTETERVRSNLQEQLKEVQRLQIALTSPTVIPDSNSKDLLYDVEDIKRDHEDSDLDPAHDSPYKDIGRAITSAPSTPLHTSSVNNSTNGVRRIPDRERPFSYHHPNREGATTPPPVTPIPPLSAGSLTPSPIGKTSIRVKIARRTSQIVNRVSGRDHAHGQGHNSSAGSVGNSEFAGRRPRSTSESNKLHKLKPEKEVPDVPELAKE